MHFPLRTHWRRQPLHFGEWLARPLLAHFGLEIEWSRPDASELLATGEGLDLIPDHSRAMILGAGFRWPETVARLPKAQLHALRGRLSAEKIGADSAVPLGDLALLADTLIAPPPPHDRLGLVLDASERAEPLLSAWLQRHADRVAAIGSDTADASAVVAQIAACRAVLTTSVAGLAVAWSCGVPALQLAKEPSSRTADFEFQDLRSAFFDPPAIGPRIIVSHLAQLSPDEIAARAEPHPPDLAARKAALRGAIRRLCANLPSRPLGSAETRVAPPLEVLAAPASTFIAERPETAARLLRAALAESPRDARLRRELGRALRELGEPQAAVAELLRATQLAPGDAEAALLLGRVFEDLRRVDLACTAFAAAARAAPEWPDAVNPHALALASQGQIDRALELWTGLVARHPSYRVAHDNLVYYRPFAPGCDRAALRATQAAWQARHAAPLACARTPHANDPAPERPLRIGYVSPDFRYHALCHFSLPVFRHHDAAQFQVYAYDLRGERDRATHLHRAHVAHWRDVAGLSDEAIAAQIRTDQVDILVDLAHHMARNRLPVFARKPAPVQVAWIAYPGGTGLETIDYRLTDALLDPPGPDDAAAFEKPVRLPNFWCYDPLVTEPAVSPLPALARGEVTFGCLNTFTKINAVSLALWACVLRAVPRSRLVLLAPPGPATENVRAVFAREGIAASRVVLQTRQPRGQYLAHYRWIDLMLDPVPVGGHTTLCDALWMGVPTVSLPGEPAICRGGLSLLSAVGLTDWIAASPEDYVRIAVEKSADLAALAALRTTLRDRFARSPVMDAPRFVRAMEAAYRTMWRTWCAQAGARPAPR